jgi:hypothetical protein
MMLFFDGGGILNNGILTLLNSTITDNEAEGNGGGIFNSGALTITNCTIANNIASGAGGAVGNSGTLTITNSTITNNRSSTGGAIFNDTEGISAITNSTIFGNEDGETRGGGILNSGRVELQNTILANNRAFPGPDCSGSVNSMGNNLIGNPSDCSITSENDSDLTGVDPGLGSFEESSTPGAGHAPLLPQSHAIDAGNQEACTDNPLLAMDQLGQPRVDGDSDGMVVCDIGAIEFQ